MRFGIWSAVSTKSQATTDKISLAEQQEKCRSAGESRGWIETAGPYLVPGATRSFYVNLSDAEKDIPPLRQMLEDARNDRFDVLVIYTYDRLGDLVDMIAQSLRFYGKQIYSVSQPVEPQEPDDFDPYAAEAEAIMRDAARITQRFRINDLRRKYRAGMPVRVKKGLNPFSIPFGYKWVSKKEPPALVPEHAALILQMRDMFLRGQTIRSIVRFVKSSGVPSPRRHTNWDATSVRYILGNPFYAGFVALNKSKTVRDPRRKNQKKQIPQPRSKWMLEKGLHKPLWDENMYRTLVDELERRRESNINYAARFPISGLLECAVCGQKLHRQSYGGYKGKPRYKVLSCKDGRVHVVIPYEQAVDRVFREFAQHIQQERLNRLEPKTDRSVYECAIDDLTTRRKRVQEGFEVGLYDKAEAAERLNEIERQMDEIRFKMEEGVQMSRARQEFFGLLPEHVDEFPQYLKEEEAEFVHRLLLAFIVKIVVHPDKRFEVIWRT